MSCQIPPTDPFLLAKARDDTERELVKSVEKRTREYMAHTQVEDFEIEARAYWIARAVFKSEYESSLAKIVLNPTDRKLLAGIY